MTPVKSYDYVVIGAGSGGLTVAVGLAKLSKNVFVVSEDIGGDCTHTGCIPSKRFLHLAHTYHSSKNSTSEISKENIFIKIRNTIHEIEHEDINILHSNNIPYVLGTACFISDHKLELTQTFGKKQIIRFKHAIISTGSSPNIIPIAGIPSERILTNESVFDLERIPKTLTIIGGGPIGVEMATAFAKMDTKVRMIVRSALLSNQPRRTTDIVTLSLQELGVDIYEDIKSFLYNNHSQSFDLFNKQNEKIVSIPGSEYYLVALGRNPNVKTLKLEHAGIVYDSDGIRTNNNLQTSKHHIFAIGDVTPEAKFTHLANNHGRFVVSKILLPWVQRKRAILPAVTFSDPPIASVGLNQEETFIKGFEIDFSTSDRAKIEEQSKLFGIIFIHMLTGRIVGASIVGNFSEHIINFFTLAIQKKVSIFGLSNFMTPYPTYFNSFNNLYVHFLNEFKNSLKHNIYTFLKFHSMRIIAIILWVIIAVFLLQYLQSLDYNLTLLARNLAQLFTSKAGAIYFILIYSLRATISFSATVLTLLAGSLYGFWKGLFLTVIASNLSSTVAYFLGKTIFSSESKDRAKESHIHGSIRKNAFEGILIFRLAGFPYDLLSYISGALRIPFWKFIAATAIGSLPGSVAIVSIGASVKNIENFENIRIDPRFLGLGILLAAVSIGISLYIKSKKRN